MPCGSYGVTQVLVGLHRVGVVGLRQALGEINSLGLVERDLIVDNLLDRLSEDNLIPNHMIDDYRVTLWREYLRPKGHDLSEFYSQVEVTLRCRPNDNQSDFVEKLTSVFADFELRPIITTATTDSDFEGPSPQLLYGDHMIVQGQKSRERLKAAVRMSFSDW
ncbi:MAG: hypothetical protein GY906_00185 [bacterium]|nr:hypothetical protein [bacterium]